MKRSASEDVTPPSSPLPKTPPTKAKKAPAGSPSNKSRVDHGPNPAWTPERRSHLIAEILAIGLKNIKLEDLAATVGLTKQQVRDATQTGKNNLRQRVIDAAGGLGK